MQSPVGLGGSFGGFGLGVLAKVRLWPWMKRRFAFLRLIPASGGKIVPHPHSHNRVSSVIDGNYVRKMHGLTDVLVLFGY